MKVIVAFSFASQGSKQSPCNERLADVVIKIQKETRAKVMAQWEVARIVEKQGLELAHVVEPLVDGSYLSTSAVWLEVRAYLVFYQINEVIIVANPFIHGYAIERMIKKDGFKVNNSFDQEIGQIGFDQNSVQWWTRGPLRFIFYAMLSFLHLAKYFR